MPALAKIASLKYQGIVILRLRRIMKGKNFVWVQLLILEVHVKI